MKILVFALIPCCPSSQRVSHCRRPLYRLCKACKLVSRTISRLVMFADSSLGAPQTPPSRWLDRRLVEHARTLSLHVHLILSTNSLFNLIHTGSDCWRLFH